MQFLCEVYSEREYVILQFFVLFCNRLNANRQSILVIKIAILSSAGKLVQLVVKS
jgi:hypothetical protein